MCLLFLLLPLLLLAGAANAQAVLVLTPDSFRPALTKWQRHRESQGYKVTVRRPGADVKGFAYVLLLGDVEQVPCNYQPGEIIKRWERDPRIAKRRLLHAAADDKDRRFIDMLATPYQRDPKLRAEERAEHLYLYNLLGDPTMRIPLPAKAKIGAVRQGDKLEVTGDSPMAGEALIELVTPRTPNRPRRVGDRAEDFRKAYERANHRHVAQTSMRIPKGAFKAAFDLPARGRYVVRIFVGGKTGTAAGAAKVVVE